jgi:hypothetical protein
MTNQELFDECVGHVLRQGKPGVDTDVDYLSCNYKSPQGTCCAVGGPLVRRGLYESAMEGNPLSADILAGSGRFLEHGRKLLREALLTWGVVDEQISLLRAIQVAHDTAAKLSKYKSQDFVTSFKFHAHGVSIQHELNALIFDTFSAGEPA